MKRKSLFLVLSQSYNSKVEFENMAEEQTSQDVERHYITRNGRLLSNTCMQENSLIKML